MRLGVCYYPEHWPEARWETDAWMMAAAGIDLVRLAEFAWAKMEPAEGVYDWAWLDQAIDVLAAAGHQIVLGTPTATPPIWLTRAHPEILRVDADGQRREHGSRRHYCPTSPVYRRFSRQIVTAMAERYGRHPQVIGWQIDNEWGGGNTARCYCRACAMAFRAWLQARYGQIETLNQAWGAVFWSQSYADWDQIHLPDRSIDKPNPSHLLDYYRFSSDAHVAYQKLQVDLLRRLAPDHFITTNFMGLYRDLDPFDLARGLDFITWDSYPTGNVERWRDHLYPCPSDGATEAAYDVGDPYVTGMAHALMRSLKDRPFWIMEQQAGAINWGRLNQGIRPGTTRLWSWHALAEGADTLVYFRWRSTLFAQEQYHSGLLRHDGSAAVGLGDVETLARERPLLARLADQPNQARVAIVVDFDDLWAIEIQPHRRDFDYLKHLFVFYRACLQLGIQVDLVAKDGDLGRYDLVLAPTLHLVDAGLVSRLEGYVASGGTLMLGVRSGFKTASNLVTDQPLPGLLRPLVGATVLDWQSLPAGHGWVLSTSLASLSGPADYWVEALRPLDDSTQALATYTSGPYAGLAALTQHVLGQGSVFYMGWYPSLEQARAMMIHLATRLMIPRIADLPSGLLARQRGDTVVLLNFTDAAQEGVVAGQAVAVGPRGVAAVPLGAAQS